MTSVRGGDNDSICMFNKSRCWKRLIITMITNSKHKALVEVFISVCNSTGSTPSIKKANSSME